MHPLSLLRALSRARLASAFRSCSSRALLPLLLGPCAALTPSSASAAGPAAERLDRIQVTATRREEGVLEIPASVTVLDEQALRKRMALTVADALRGEPGTFVQQTTPGQGNVIIRGLKGSEVLHLVDGFRLNHAFFRNAPNQYLALVDPLMLAGIEAVRGPMSTLYGSDAMGGVLQFLSWRPSFAGEHWQQQGGLRMRSSSADDARQLRLFEAIGRDDLHFAAGYSDQDVNGRRVGGGERLPFTDYRQRAADFAAEHRRGDHWLRLSLQHSEQPETPRHDALVSGFGQTAAESAEQLFKPQARRFSQLRYRYSAPLPFADSIELQAGLQRMTDDRVSRDSGSANRDTEANLSRLEGFSAQFDRALGERHYLSYGFEWYGDRVASFRERQNINSGAVSARPSRFPDASRMRSQALYLADDFLPAPGWDVNIGLRYSRFDIELPATASGPGVRLRPDDLSGHFGVVRELGEGLRLVGNLGRGFRAPNVFDLGLLGERPGNRFNLPNPELRPETVLTVDAGLKLQRGAWQGEAIAFRSQYRDKISSVLTGERTDRGREIVQSRNITEQVLNGVETALRYDDGGAFAVRAAATWTRGEERVEALETPADRIPPLFGSLSGSWRFAPDFELETWALFAGRQGRLSPRDVSDPRINPAGTAGWATLNVRLGWAPSEAVNLALSAHNLGDRRYREHGSGLDAPGRDLGLALDWRW
jgi:outer membrane receptor protein involved in Fe transport